MFIGDVESVPLLRVRQVWDHMITNKVDPDVSMCTASIDAHTHITTKHSLTLLSALSVFEHGLEFVDARREFNTEKTNVAVTKMYNSMISCAFRHENNAMADRVCIANRINELYV